MAGPELASAASLHSQSLLKSRFLSMKAPGMSHRDGAGDGFIPGQQSTGGAEECWKSDVGSRTLTNGMRPSSTSAG